MRSCRPSSDEESGDDVGTTSDDDDEMTSDDDDDEMEGAPRARYDQRKHACRAECAAMRCPDADPLRGEYHPDYMDMDAELAHALQHE